ncbi:hypothetical protein [Methylocapsa aurea]|uniref:hypothetical protein n=1 Tax=Methylocapsa aurea TaxID=663610 RepID=UPI003D18FAF6
MEVARIIFDRDGSQMTPNRAGAAAADRAMTISQDRGRFKRNVAFLQRVPKNVLFQPHVGLVLALHVTIFLTRKTCGR